MKNIKKNSKVFQTSASQVSVSSTSNKNINYFKARANILLKQLRQTDLIVESELRHRLEQCGQLAILQQRSPIKRKQALTIIALEAGFDSWSELKRQLELENAIDFQTFFCFNGTGGFLNHWFNNYQQAKSLQLDRGGIVLPYRHQFFVAKKGYLERLGFSQDDADWQAIEYDWIVPKSLAAKQKIMQRIVASRH